MTLTQIDPRNLIRESYRIEGIIDAQCRSIFLDWALGLPTNQDYKSAIQGLLDHYAPQYPDHPMTQVLQAGLIDIPTPKRRRRN